MKDTKDKHLISRETGLYKQIISGAFYKNDGILKLLIGDTSKMDSAKIRKEFKNHVKPHLFVDETVKETDTFIYYDVVVPEAYDNIKNCRIIAYVICHRDSLEDDFFYEDYIGNRVDIGIQMIESALLDKNVIHDFGIGKLEVDSINVYQSPRFYGKVIEFTVPNFR